MQFSSPLLLFYLIPVFCFIYFLMPKQFKNLLFLVFSISTYLFFSRKFAVVLIISIFFNFLLGLLLEKKTNKIVLSAGIVFNLLILGIFKYSDFFLNNFNQIFHISGIQSNLSFIKIFIPIGISFFSLQNIGYLVDIYRGNIESERNIIRYSLFISMFPTIMMGPIERYGNLRPSLIEKDISVENISIGIRRFVYGLAQKVMIADNLNYSVNLIFSSKTDQLSSLIAWVGVILFSLQLYYDFCGYSNMAIGLSRIFGIKLMENFNYPYKSRSIQEFWQRWHISLSTWLSDYIFKPLQFRYRNLGRMTNVLCIILTFFVSGLWHGANWNFILWGLYHGVFLSLEFLFLGAFLKKCPEIISRLYFLIIISIGWVFFRIDNLSDSFKYISKMFSFSLSGEISLKNIFSYELLIFSFLAVVFVNGFDNKIFSKFSLFSFFPNARIIYASKILVYFISFLLILSFSVLYIAVHEYQPFLYGAF